MEYLSYYLKPFVSFSQSPRYFFAESIKQVLKADGAWNSQSGLGEFLQLTFSASVLEVDNETSFTFPFR